MKQGHYGKTGDVDPRKFDLRFDAENQLAYFGVENMRPGDVQETKEWTDATVHVDYNEAGDVIGIEII